jgi:catechol 2,3-dioxygenase-like lactoylglutathione lyase family enzyme
MAASFLEHVNVTVSDPAATAEMLCTLFGWQIRWQGESIYHGKTVHVGGKESYVACYSIGDSLAPQAGSSYHVRGGLNHIGVVVADLDAVEAKVKALGFQPHAHSDYEPGRRFYFNDSDGIEFEVVSYDKAG